MGQFRVGMFLNEDQQIHPLIQIHFKTCPNAHAHKKQILMSQTATNMILYVLLITLIHVSCPTAERVL